jgi:hypothetical protein
VPFSAVVLNRQGALFSTTEKNEGGGKEGLRLQGDGAAVVGGREGAKGRGISSVVLNRGCVCMYVRNQLLRMPRSASSTAASSRPKRPAAAERPDVREDDYLDGDGVELRPLVESRLSDGESSADSSSRRRNAAISYCCLMFLCCLGAQLATRVDPDAIRNAIPFIAHSCDGQGCERTVMIQVGFLLVQYLRPLRNQKAHVGAPNSVYSAGHLHLLYFLHSWLLPLLARRKYTTGGGR